MQSTSDAEAPINVYTRVPSGKLAVFLLLLLGVPFFGASINLALSGKGLGEWLGLMGVSMLFNVPAMLIVRHYIKVKREKEVLWVFSDRIEKRTSTGATTFPFSALQALEGKITTFERSGNQIHEYRLSFGALGSVSMDTKKHPGVDGDTGRLLQRLTGARLGPLR